MTGKIEQQFKYLVKLISKALNARHVYISTVLCEENSDSYCFCAHSERERDCTNTEQHSANLWKQLRAFNHFLVCETDGAYTLLLKDESDGTVTEIKKGTDISEDEFMRRRRESAN